MLFIVTPLVSIITLFQILPRFSNTAEVILPVKVIVPQTFPMFEKNTEAVPMSNVFVPLPNCMVIFALLALSRIATMTVVICWFAVPTIAPLLVAVNDVPLPAIM
jgi:hypothetical protein